MRFLHINFIFFFYDGLRREKNDDGTSEAKKRYDNGKQKIAMGDFQENNQHKSGEKKKKEIEKLSHSK